MTTPPLLQKALESLKKHQPVAIPTETVYGLAAPVGDIIAIRKVFHTQGTPSL